MLKKQKTKKYVRTNIIIVGIIFSTLFLVGTAQATVTVTSKLQGIYEKIKNNPKLDQLPGGSVSNLYETALGVVKENELVPGKEALIQVRKEINNSPNCEEKLEDSDIMNIIFSSDHKTLFTFQGLLAKDIDEKDLFINHVDFVESCNKLMQCTTQKDSKAPHTNCINMIQEKFSSAEKNLKAHHELRMGNYGKNFFQNANADDSAFDLLIDIEMVGNILFEEFKPSSDAEVLFYKMPERNDENDSPQIGDTFTPSSGIIYPGDPNANGDINRFDIGEGGYPATGFQCPKNIEAATNSFDPPIESSTGTDNQNTSIQNNTINKDLSDISDPEKQKNIFYVDGVGTIGNICSDYQECGNGIIEGTEECDDKNTSRFDGCSENCKKEFCGDGIIQIPLGEKCDDRNKNNNDSCLNNCKKPYCGDGFIRQGHEDCDYMVGIGNNIKRTNRNNTKTKKNTLYTESLNGCTLSCTLVNPEFCGDGKINGNEQCDDGNDDKTDDCRNDCEKNICGDGVKHARREQCDDNNTIGGDGCSTLCQLEESPYCGDGNPDPGEECDDGNNNNNDSCLNNCKEASCGDGYIHNEDGGNETCDDGNISSYDCCSNTCQNEGFITPEDMFLGDMLTSLDALAGNKGPKIDNNCLENCKDLPLDDRILCSIECACGEVPSPEFGSVEAGAFKLKYCMIPAEAIEVTKESKTIFSIEEIFTALKTLLAGLKDSGEMVKTVETKEMLESSMLKNNFADMFAFNVNVSFKPLLGGSTNKTIEDHKAINLNKDLKQSLINIATDPSLPTEKNKYVVAMDIAGSRARLRDFQSIEGLNAEIQAEANKLKEKIVLSNKILDDNGNIDQNKVDKYMQDILDNQFTTQISEEFMVFLSMNHTFRGQVNSMFEQIYGATELLRTKIESGS